MRIEPAQYLLRFDDLCPTMSRARWERLVQLIGDFGLQPILAVVPENRDPALAVEDVDPNFWLQMRGLEAAGAMIGLHGYRHLCVSRGRSLAPLRHTSEFAGVPEETQRAWIRAGLEILCGHGLNPKIWVAPRHGFDGATLNVLRQEGIGVVSDGLVRLPFTRCGLTWIPQQLWSPVEKSGGLWTICLHPGTASDGLVLQLRQFLANHAAQFTSVDRVLAEYQPAELKMSERLYEAWALWRKQASRLRKQWMPPNE
jgi:predicted deacetylase